MAETETRESRALSLSPDRFLSAPPVHSARRRSASAAPSHLSIQSHVTGIEDKEDIPGFDVSDLKGTQVKRQQTYKFGRTVGLMDRIKGVFFPKLLMAKMEDSIEVVTSEAPDDEMFHRRESPWIVDVYVSPKLDSMNYHKTLCLLDTGCSHGNIVSKDLVHALGFTDADYQELSELESQGGVTMGGQPFPVEAAIFLSWHHNTSLKRLRQMRFLISSHAKTFDMIIGAQTICKYSLMSGPVFSLESGVVKSSSTDGGRNHLVNERSALKSKIDTCQYRIEKEKNEQNATRLKTELSELKHLLDLKKFEIDARDAKTDNVKATFISATEKTTRAWDLKHPENTTEMVKARYQASQGKAAPAPASTASNGNEASDDTSKGPKRSSVSNRGMRSRKH